jgi:predicted CXXCH cytochrome family protein
MMKQNKMILAGMMALTLFFFTPWAPAADIRSTKHDLSISGTGDIGASSENQVCIFCHIPHREGSKMAYLWNRSSPLNPYTPYDSSTLKADVGQPTGSSRMCLSCHDGTIALGAIASTPAEIPFKGGIRFMPDNRPSNLGTDLSDDHPVSFSYDTALSRENVELKDPALLPSVMRLENDHQLQCITCHDPHDDAFGRFLVMDNTASSLCMACHDKKGWNHSSHFSSNALLARAGGLWPNTPYLTVAENGCENCHIPHSAGTGERLLIFGDEEETCYACHSGTIASKNIAAAISKPYRHPVDLYRGIHDPVEDFTSGHVPAHVECSDCHDGHQANDDPSLDGVMVSGANRGASGISASGAALAEARFTYEICFKCHGDNNVINTLSIPRQIDQLNTRLEFDPANPSYHPVEAPGKNPDVPSLLPSHTISSTISCTDCHGASEGLPNVKGPHGSDWPHLLIDQYVTDASAMNPPSSYGLCYTCHSQESLLNDESFSHAKHVVDKGTPCSVCHDPHGVNYMQGSSMHNSHLINFDLSVVSQVETKPIEYNHLGRFQGECFLTCHNEPHNPKTYQK